MADEEAMLVVDAAKELGLSRQRVNQLARTGEIRVVEHEPTSGRGRLWLSVEDVMSLKERRAKESRNGGEGNPGG